MISDERVKEKDVAVGILEGGRIILTAEDKVQELYQSGFGRFEGKKLVLDIYEGLYLNEHKRIEISYKNKSVKFSELMEKFYKRDKNVLTRYLVYRDLRSRGFIVRGGSEVGADFCIFDKNEDASGRARYAVFVLNEGFEIEFEKIFEKVKNVKKACEEAIVAVLDRRGEVIYYQVSEAAFHDRLQD